MEEEVLETDGACFVSITDSFVALVSFYTFGKVVELFTGALATRGAFCSMINFASLVTTELLKGMIFFNRMG